MSLFTTDRERRLWLWTLAVVVAIYSTLGPARTLVDALRERNLLRVAFAVVALCVIGVVVARWLKQRPGWREIGVGLGVALAYGFILLRIENPAERTHLFEYGIVAALIHQALLERARHGRHVPWPAALTVGVTAALGLIDEGIQAVLPTRVFDWNDVVFNALAGFMVTAARLALEPVLRPGWRLWFLWTMAAAFGWGWPMDPASFGLPRPVEILSSLPVLNVPLFASVAAGGLLVGVYQSLALRRYVPGSLHWFLASTGAVGLSALVFFGGGAFDAHVGWLASVGLYGVIAGVLQWLVLRPCVPRAGWWVVASTVSWLVSLPVGDMTGPPGWALHGAMSGVALVWLLRAAPPPPGQNAARP